LLNPKSRQVASELRSPYELHRTISKAFAFAGENVEKRLLFRVEPEVHRYIVLLIQSLTKPDWNKLTVNANYFMNGNVKAIEVKDYSPTVVEQELYSFRLLANPVKKDIKTGKRVALYKEEELLSWLERKGSNSGFKVKYSEIRKGDFVTTKSKNQTELNSVHLCSTLFQGVLQVTEALKFNVALESGIGTAKGFGFGLLSIARYKE
jgi:CRISPR system Cascade subunit CasE